MHWLKHNGIAQTFNGSKRTLLLEVLYFRDVEWFLTTQLYFWVQLNSDSELVDSNDTQAYFIAVREYYILFES